MLNKYIIHKVQLFPGGATISTTYYNSDYSVITDGVLIATIAANIADWLLSNSINNTGIENFFYYWLQIS